MIREISVIPRLDIKGPNLIKGLQFEGLRVVGDPSEFAKRYYLEGADELLFVDNVASLYGRELMDALLSAVTEEVFIPITVAGGIRSVADAVRLLRHGADKVAVNTGAIDRPGLLNELVNEIGSQSVVLSVEAKSDVRTGTWNCLKNFGRDTTELEVGNWINEAIDRGVGEILLTSVDRDGMGSGLDFELLKRVESVSTVPMILSGGFGRQTDLGPVAASMALRAIASGRALHYRETSILGIKEALIGVRS